MDPGLTRLLEVLDGQFAYVTDGVRNVLAQTSTCQNWAGDMVWDPERRNLGHWVFLSPHARHVFPFWEREPAASVIASLRGQLARMPADAELRAIIDELCELSPDARKLWDARDQLRFHPSPHVTLRLPGHTDPGQLDDDRYHVTATVAQLMPTRPGHEHRFTVFLLPDEYDVTSALPDAAPCAACARELALTARRLDAGPGDSPPVSADTVARRDDGDLAASRPRRLVSAWRPVQQLAIEQEMRARRRPSWSRPCSNTSSEPARISASSIP
jgi:hypothetical protein